MFISKVFKLQIALAGGWGPCKNSNWEDSEPGGAAQPGHSYLLFFTSRGLASSLDTVDTRQDQES